MPPKGQWRRRDSNPRPSGYEPDELPLLYSTLIESKDSKWELPESNWRHKDFQSFALPSELSPRVEMTRLELVTARLSAECSTTELHFRMILAPTTMGLKRLRITTHTGFEPVISTVTGWRDKPLH
jgi:hypothetical protein